MLGLSLHDNIFHQDEEHLTIRNTILTIRNTITKLTRIPITQVNQANAPSGFTFSIKTISSERLIFVAHAFSRLCCIRENKTTVTYF